MVHEAFWKLLRQARAANSDPSCTVLDHILSLQSDLSLVAPAMMEHTSVVAMADAQTASGLVILKLLPKDICFALHCVPLHLSDEPRPRIGLVDPWDDLILRKLTAALGYVPELAAITGLVLRTCLAEFEHASKAELKQEAQVQVLGPVQTAVEQESVVEFVDGAINQALTVGASDIHFECDRRGVGVKFRQDGVMSPWRRLQSTQRAEETISRIKVLAQLDITERRVPQDGRFRWNTGGGAGVDMRVSIMPSIHGEDAVLRLLDKAQLRQADKSRNLDALGFEATQAQRIRELAALPHGMLLVTGPTGSGKTTTVYATLSEVNSGLEKIVTIEDPVEYELPGVLQIPVNEKKGLTFARGLRSILRHDPDRILVGEIRDAETAEIAVQSALTGHQVFTTVHANSIFDVVGRFRHFGLDMFGFMSSLNGVIVQRLLRKLCASCALSPDATNGVGVWRAVGCVVCRGSGYRGRLVVAEVHVLDDHMRDLVTAGASMSALRERVRHQAGKNLAEQGAQLAAQGATTLEEVRRVVGS